MTQEEQKQFNLLSGKVALAAQIVLKSNVFMLSHHLYKLELALKKYDNFVIGLTNKEEQQ